MDWSKGFTATYYAAVIDADTWHDAEILPVTGGSISRSEADLKESAEIQCTRYDQTNERWVRIYMDAEQVGGSAHVPLFTGLAVSPDRDIDGIVITNSVACYSVLKPAQDVLLKRGWYAPKGLRGADLVEQLLSVTPAPKETIGVSPKLPSNIVAENGETNLTMALKILDAINWRLRLSGDGTITICAQPEATVAQFDNLENDSIEPRLKVKYDWYTCPNVFRVVSGDKSVEVKDTDPDSRYSVVSRGREIWAEDTSPAFNGSETITMYAKRRLNESQRAAYSVSYDRRFHPDVTVGDYIDLHYPAQSIDNIFRVKSQSITLDAGGRTSEEVVRIEQ